MHHNAPIADRIIRDWFRDISRYLHIVNDTLVPSGSPGHYRLGKVRSKVDHLSVKLAELYNPHCETAVDEAMDKVLRAFLTKTIHAHETNQAWYQGVGASWQPYWLLLLSLKYTLVKVPHLRKVSDHELTQIPSCLLWHFFLPVCSSCQIWRRMKVTFVWLQGSPRLSSCTKHTKFRGTHMYTVQNTALDQAPWN